MINVFEKVCKTEKNEFGMEEVKDENPFGKGPCIITILPVPQFFSQINGFMRLVADIVNPDIDDNYDPDRRIFGLGFGTINRDMEVGVINYRPPVREDINEFLEKYFHPLFLKDGKPIDVFDAMKNFRNLTIVTYCDGAVRYKVIEGSLYNKLVSFGYTDADARMILSQICLAAVSGTVIRYKGSYATSICFGDAYDTDYFSNRGTQVGLEELGGSGYITFDSTLGYAIAGDGNHDLPTHMSSDTEVSRKIGILLNFSINNALENRNYQILNPLTYEKIENAFNEDKGKSL